MQLRKQFLVFVIPGILLSASSCLAAPQISTQCVLGYYNTACSTAPLSNRLSNCAKRKDHCVGDAYVQSCEICDAGYTLFNMAIATLPCGTVFGNGCAKDLIIAECRSDSDCKGPVTIDHGTLWFNGTSTGRCSTDGTCTYLCSSSIDVTINCDAGYEAKSDRFGCYCEEIPECTSNADCKNNSIVEILGGTKITTATCTEGKCIYKSSIHCSSGYYNGGLICSKCPDYSNTLQDGQGVISISANRPADCYIAKGSVYKDNIGNEYEFTEDCNAQDIE